MPDLPRWLRRYAAEPKDACSVPAIVAAVFLKEVKNENVCARVKISVHIKDAQSSDEQFVTPYWIVHQRCTSQSSVHCSGTPHPCMHVILKTCHLKNNVTSTGSILPPGAFLLKWWSHFVELGASSGSLEVN